MMLQSLVRSSLSKKTELIVYFMEHRGGACFEMKWLPISSTSDKGNN